MTQQLGDGRIAYVHARSAHDAEPSLRQNRLVDVSGALAFTAGVQSDRHFASVFVTGADGLRLHVRSYGARVASALPALCRASTSQNANQIKDVHVGTNLATTPLVGREQRRLV